MKFSRFLLMIVGFVSSDYAMASNKENGYPETIFPTLERFVPKASPTDFYKNRKPGSVNDLVAYFEQNSNSRNRRTTVINYVRFSKYKK